MNNEYRFDPSDQSHAALCTCSAAATLHVGTSMASAKPFHACRHKRDGQLRGQELDRVPNDDRLGISDGKILVSVSQKNEGPG